MRDPKEFSVFVARLAQAKRASRDITPRSIAQDAEELRACARRINAIHERQCNGYQGPLRNGVRDGWDERAEQRDERAEARAIARAKALASKYGFELHVQGDPRGLPLYLGYAPYMTANNYSTTGFGVPL